MQDTAISEMEPSIKTTHKRKTVFKSGTRKGHEWVTLCSCFHCYYLKGKTALNAVYFNSHSFHTSCKIQ